MFSTTTMESSTSKPKRDDESRDRDLVERVAEEVQRRQSDRERQRNRDHDDARGAQPERQQRDRDQRDGDREIAAEPAETARDVLRLIEADVQLDALRQTTFEALRGREDPLAHVEDVVAVFLVRRHEHRALTVEAADVAMLLRAPAHLRDVAHAHRAAIRDRDDGVAHFIERLVAAGCLEAEAAAARRRSTRPECSRSRSVAPASRDLEPASAPPCAADRARRAARAPGMPRSARCGRRRPS